MTSDDPLILEDESPLCLASGEFECTACSFYGTSWCWMLPWDSSVPDPFGAFSARALTDAPNGPLPFGDYQPLEDNQVVIAARSVLERVGIPLHVDQLMEIMAASTKLKVSRRVLVSVLRADPSVSESADRSLVFLVRSAAEIGGDAVSSDNRQPADPDRLSALEQMLDGLAPSVLTRADESRLARAIEIGRVASEFEEAGQRIRSELSNELHRLNSLSTALAVALDLPRSQPVEARFRSPRFRMAIDGVLDEELLRAAATAISGGHLNEVRQAVVRLSACSHIFIELLPSTSNRAVRRRLKGMIDEANRSIETLVQYNGRLVVWVARRYRKAGLPWEDMIQEGYVGLMRAAQRFDQRRGTKFSTYAVWWIRQAISRAIADQSRLIRLPVHVWEAQRAAGDVDEVLQDPVSLDEILQRLPTAAGSLGRQEGAVAENEVESSAMEAALSDDIEHALKSLDDRARQVIRYRFGLEDDEPLTLEEVGQLYGVTRERIRQIQEKALRVLRAPARQALLRPYASMDEEPRDLPTRRSLPPGEPRPIGKPSSRRSRRSRKKR